MRAAFLCLGALLAVCSCAGDPPSAAATSTPQPGTSPEREIALGDGWIVSPKTVAADGTSTLTCFGFRLADANGVSVGLQYPSDSRNANAGVQLVLIVPAGLIGSTTPDSFFLIQVPGRNELIPIDPASIAALDGKVALGTAQEFGPQLTRALAAAQRIELMRTDRRVTNTQRVLTVEIPRQQAVRAAMRRCEATGASEEATRAAYFQSAR